MTNRTIILTVLAILTLAGCTVTSSGDPQPSSDTSDKPSTTESADPKFADLLPPRPRELDLDGVDPCADLFTDQQLRELGYDLGYARPPRAGRSNIHGGANCTFASNGGTGGTNRNMLTLVGISTTEGATAWVTDPTRTPDTRPEVVTIQDFSALVLPHPKLADECKVVVDTAEGQYLEVSAGSGDGKGSSHEPYCQEAERVAGMAIQTISKTR